MDEGRAGGRGMESLCGECHGARQGVNSNGFTFPELGAMLLVSGLGRCELAWLLAPGPLLQDFLHSLSEVHSRALHFSPSAHGLSSGFVL